MTFASRSKLVLWVCLFCSIATTAFGQGVYRELWTNLTTSVGNSLTALTNTTYNPNWPNNPAAIYTRVFTNCETETNLKTKNGQRYRTFD